MGSPYPIERAEEIQARYAERFLLTLKIPAWIRENISTKTLMGTLHKT
jgi:hypothetical protein